MDRQKQITFIFDFDGTLADTLETSRLVGNQLAPWFGLEVVPENTFQALRNLTISEIQAHLGIPTWKIPLFLFFFRRQMFKVLPELDCPTGIPEILHQLHQSQIRLGICTSNNHLNVKTFLEHHHLRSLFDFIHSGAKILGKAQRIRSLLDRYHLDPSQAYYVGDEIRDVVAAHHAGIKAIAVAWGFNTPEALASVNPDFLIQSPAQLQSVVEAIDTSTLPGSGAIPS